MSRRFRTLHQDSSIAPLNMVTFSIIATSLVSFIPSLLPVRQRVSNLPTSTGKRSKPMLSILEDGSPKKLSLTQIGGLRTVAPQLMSGLAVPN